MEQIAISELKCFDSSNLVSTDLIIEEDLSERVRLQSTRYRLFYGDLDNSFLVNSVVPAYLKWIRQSEYLIFGEYNKITGYTRFWGSLASKRGNSKYAQRLSRRFDPLQSLPDTKFFNYKDRGSHHKTRGIFITLTYNPENLTIGEAWRQVGDDYNRFITAFRKKYGKTSVLRVWESQQNGYPHIHMLAISQNHEFEAFHYEGVWRVNDKREIEALWNYGFSDVEALSSTKGGMTYIAKYLGKLHTIGSQVNEEEIPQGNDTCLSGLVSRASVLTLSMMWLFRKRAFSISGELSDLIRDLHNSNSDTRAGQDLELLQLDLEGGAGFEYIMKVVLLGFWGGRLLKGGNYPRWSVDLSASQIRKLKRSSSWSDNRHLE